MPAPQPPLTVIAARTSRLHLPWREVWQYRDLLLLLVRRDFVAKYKQTVLGPAWFIVQPVLMTFVFTIVFGRVAKIPTDGLPRILFYLSGMLAWTYFSECLKTTSTTFVTNAQLFGKVYFPRVVVPLAVVVSNLIALAIQIATFAAFWAYFKFATAAGERFVLTSWALATPLLVLQTAALGLGVGLWMSSLTAKYRDFFHLSTFITQVWLYATPIVYPLSEVPEKWRWASVLNPMTTIVESVRIAFLGAGSVRPEHVVVSVLMTCAILFTGLLIFSRTERDFIDTV